MTGMTARWRATGWTLAGMVLLGGCGEFTFTDTPTTDEEAFAALQAETVALREDVAGLTATTPTMLPATGAAQYDGTALIALDPVGGAASELIGTATITADFAARTVAGQADGFVGTAAGADVTTFGGTLFLSGGAIDTTGGDQIGAGLNGTLQGGGDTLVVDGSVEGNFLGDPAVLGIAPPGMSLESGAETSFTLNGEAVTGGMEIIAVQ